MKGYQVKIEFLDKVYGGMPKAKELLDNWIKSKGEMPLETMGEKEEVLDFEETAEFNKTGFRRNDDGEIFLRDFQVLACMKQACQALGLTKKIRGLKGFMEAGLVVGPRELVPFNGTGESFCDPSGTEELQGRVMTAQGPRSVLSEKEYIENARLIFNISFIYEDEKSKAIEKSLPKVLEVMGNLGLGSSRSRLEGKFSVVDVEEVN